MHEQVSGCLLPLPAGHLRRSVSTYIYIYIYIYIYVGINNGRHFTCKYTNAFFVCIRDGR
jgi:hypothetical protein